MSQTVDFVLDNMRLVDSYDNVGPPVFEKWMCKGDELKFADRHYSVQECSNKCRSSSYVFMVSRETGQCICSPESDHLGCKKLKSRGTIYKRFDTYKIIGKLY